MSGKKLVIALAGNANVGKSVIFNYLTKLHQHIGNWPGKTVEKAEGTLHFKGYTVDVVDLPGIYSLSTYSIEESISRRFIAVEKPDVVINVIDASVLERNLFFTLQLMELETPIVIALNQVDVASKKGIQIDFEKLEKILGVPVVPTIAVKGVGIFKLLEKAVEIFEGKLEAKPRQVKYGEEVEERIEKLAEAVRDSGLPYPARYVAIKLLEGDREIQEEVEKSKPQAAALARSLGEELERLHGHSCPTLITSERYQAANCIAREVQKLVPPVKPTLGEKLHNVTTHRVAGYFIMAASLLSLFFFVFAVGNVFSDILTSLLYGFKPFFERVLGTGFFEELVWEGVVEGLIAGASVALPYIIPFYLALYFLEDSGYLSRIAFLMDSIMHKMGLHGKAFIPLILGYGCNVPACLGCRIMETQRERLIAAFVTTLVPCAARTVIILGLVGRFAGIQWALMLYAFDLLVVFLLGRIAFRILPGEPTGLIMEMPDYRLPHLKTVLSQTWFRLLEFMKIAFPLIIVSTFTVKLLETTGILRVFTSLLAPVTVAWLGLPVETGITLLFGVLRKELALIMLATLLGAADLSKALTPVQMTVFTIVSMFYIPCVATIATLVMEFGWRKALVITLSEIVLALILGGLAFRILILAGLT
ncbi:MAG: ferrous iron transport protein B [Candidatus Brockarchaeota archaeon]|nr:ferrous iron transport protein B [Candidatus Brockarchaeota archaeon]